MEQIRLNIVPQGVPPVCHVSQYDAGRVVRLILMDGLQGYVISDETFVLNVRKPDETIVTVAATGAVGDSFVDFVTTEQMAAVAGENICELKITKDDTVIGSLNFRMKVERDPLAGGIESQSEIHNLHTQVAAMVSEEVADQYDSDSVVFDPAPTEGHGIGFAVTSEGIKTAIKEATTPTGEVSGDIVSFNDALNGVPFIEVEAQIEATQGGSGTPSPDNPRPINGFSEVVVNNNRKNWINLPDDVRVNHGVTYTINNGVVTLSGTATSPYADYTFNFAGKRGTTYFLSGGVSADIYIRNTHYNKNDTGNGFSFVSDGESSTFYFRVLNGIDATGIVIKPQIEVGEAKTTFEPFRGSTHTIDLGQSVGKGVLNVTTGELTITHKVVDMGSFTWSTIGTRFITTATDAKQAQSDTSTPDIICEVYEARTPTETYFGNVGITVNSADSRIIVYDSQYATAEAFKTAVTGKKVMYELATPVTVQLTPEEVKAISGLNTVSANSGDIRVVYRKDFGIFADAVPYDNTVSGLTADNVQEAIDEVADNTYTKTEADALLADKADTADLATVATSGAYNDLTGKPTIPSIDSVTPPNQMTVGSTYQLPASVFAHGLIVLTARRYGYIGEATITRASIIGGTATQGIYCPYSATTGWLFTIDASGLLTYKQAVGSSPDPTVEIVGIF